MTVRKGHKYSPIDVREENTKIFSFFALETGAKCNRRCSFCPVSHAPREDEWMSEEMFDKILTDLESLNYKKRIGLYSYNEPCRDKRLPDLLREIRSRLPRTSIMINTNGDYFRGPDDIAQLFFAGLNQMQINVYSASDGCGDRERIDKGIEKSQRRLDKLQSWVDEIGWLDQEASIYQYVGPNAANCQVVPKWDFQPNVGGDNYAPTEKHGISKRHHIANRAGNIPDFMPAIDEPLAKMCIRPFRAMTVNWRGDVILCCNDYHAEASVGNVMDRPIEELWNDERYHAYRVKLQYKDRNIFLCDVCDYDGGFYQHNVPHVTCGTERDVEIVNADLRSPEAAGFVPVTRLRRKG